MSMVGILARRKGLTNGAAVFRCPALGFSDCDNLDKPPVMCAQHASMCLTRKERERVRERERVVEGNAILCSLQRRFALQPKQSGAPQFLRPLSTDQR